jgi:serine/threonine protein kinase
MCTGRPPFQANTTLGVLRRVSEDTPPPVRALNPALPAWLAAVIARLHAKAPAERYQTAAEVAAALASPPGLPQREAPPDATVPPRRGRRTCPRT